MLRCRVLALLCLFVVSAALFAQAPGTGIYPFGSFDRPGFDTVNLGNLNVHFEIPIVSKHGRGQNFDYRIVYDGLIWNAVTVNGTLRWQPDYGWGFHGQLNEGFAGYLSANTGYKTCKDDPNDPKTWYTMPYANTYVYHDEFGAQHLFNRSIDDPCNPSIIGDGSTNDGSGYTFDGQYVRDRYGNQLNLTLNTTSGSGSSVDTNGNAITVNSDGTFMDTLGSTALTISGGGNASSARTFTYNVVQQADSSTTASATISYTTYTVQTNFGCAGIAPYGPQTADLPSLITFADGTSYQFTYESTPGSSGNVTGRLASVTLPTGGTISYQYQYGCGNGLNADGTTGSMNRVTSDGTRSYGRAPLSNGSSTTVIDEAGRQTLYDFVSVNGFYYATHKQVFDGDTSAANLLDQYTCYNGTIPCSGTAITLPITSIQNVISHNNGAQYQTQDSYDGSSGLLTAHSDYDYGNALLQTASYSYNSLGEVTQALVQDGNNAQISKATYGYDENSLHSISGIPQHGGVSGARGNLTSSTVWIDPSTTLAASNTSYYDTGVPFSSTDPNGTTQYGYDSTQGFATQVTPPTPSSGVPLPTTASFDANSGAQLSASDANNTGTPMVQYTQYDKLLRPKQVNTVDGATISYNYGMYQNFHTFEVITPNGGNTTTLYDEYGRTSRLTVYNGNSDPQKDWYQADYCYDATGHVHFQSVRYQGPGNVASIQCSGTGTTYTYDALGRVTNVSNPDGNTQYQYNSRAVKTTDVNGVQKITQYDALGRVTRICEISGNDSHGESKGDCGTDIAGTGYLTLYNYDLANHKTTITQGQQVRSFQTDALGRTTSVSEPERGVTTYSYTYTGTGLQVTRTRPRANQSNTSVTTNTVTQYDKVGRVASISYDDGTPTKNYYYDTTQNWTNFTQTNLKGRLAGVGGTAGTVYSYDAMGRVVNMKACFPTLCGDPNHDKILWFSYDLAGNLGTEGDGASGEIAYGRSPAGEVTSITNNSYHDTYNPANLVSNIQNGPFGPTQYDLGNGRSVLNTYDASGRRSGQFLCSTSDVGNCTNSRIYGTTASYSGSRMNNSCDTIINQCASYGYDEFDRLQSTSGGLYSYTYDYDRYGNRWGQQVTAGSGYNHSDSFDPSTNHMLSKTYDAAGNMTNDQTHSYTYDAEGNITQVDGGSTATYTYDALNQRVWTQTSTATYGWLFDYAGRRISGWLAPNDFGNQGRIYWDGNQLAYRAWNGTTYFEHKDLLGTERMRTDYTGAIASTYTSLPWGDGYTANETSSVGDGLDPLHFALLDHDAESNTEHAQFRQYASGMGHWLTPDPYYGSYDASDPQSFNRYSYVGNKPLSDLDPLGLDPIIVFPLPNDPNTSTTVTTTSLQFLYIGLGATSPTGNPAGVDKPDPGASSYIPQPSAAPNNTAAQVTKQCLQQYQSSLAGKAINFLSWGSVFPGWGPDPKESLKEWGIAIGLKFGGGKLAAATLNKFNTQTVTSLFSQTAIGSSAGAGLDAMLKYGAKAALVGQIYATGIDVLVHAGCSTQGMQSAGQMTSVPNIY